MFESCLSNCMYIHAASFPDCSVNTSVVWYSKKEQIISRISSSHLLCFVSHVTHKYEACHTHLCVMSHISISHVRTSHVAHTSTSQIRYHVLTFHATPKRSGRNVREYNGTCHARKNKTKKVTHRRENAGICHTRF